MTLRTTSAAALQPDPSPPPVAVQHTSAPVEAWPDLARQGDEQITVLDYVSLFAKCYRNQEKKYIFFTKLKMEKWSQNPPFFGTLSLSGLYKVN